MNPSMKMSASRNADLVKTPVVKKLSFMSLFRKKPNAIIPVANNLLDLELELELKQNEFQVLLSQYNKLRNRICPEKDSDDERLFNAVYAKVCALSDEVFYLKKEIRKLTH